MSELLTVADVAARLKMAERTVQAMMAAQEMPGFRIKGQWRVRLADFDSWIDALAAGISANSSVIAQSNDRATEEAATVLDPNDSTAPTSFEERNLTPVITTGIMQQRFLDALGDSVAGHSDVAVKPLEVDLTDPVPEQLRVYLFNATRPAGGRPLGEHKIQLVLPGMKRGERASFDHGGGRTAILAGYSSEDDVWVLWDAGLYQNFAWSRNVQVKADTITQASTGVIATQARILRPGDGVMHRETVLACGSGQLRTALRQRIDLTVERLQEE